MIPLQSILAATDLSVTSDVVLQSAASIARRTGADLHVVHVAAPWAEDVDALHDALQMQIRRALPDVERRPEPVILLLDRPFHGILAQAAKVRADLIVVGPHRSSRLSARWLAPTAERVARAADVPCLVIRTPLTEPVRRIGVATAFSMPDRGTLDLVREWAPLLGTPQTEVRLAHVLNARSPETRNRVARQLVEEADRSVQAYPDGPFVQTELLSGASETNALVSWAQSKALQLFAMTACEHRGLQRLWTESASARMTVDAPSSILLVPAALWRRAPVAASRIAVVATPEALRADTALHRLPSWVRDLTPDRTLASLPNTGDVARAARDENVDLLVLPPAADASPTRDAQTLDAQTTSLLETTSESVLLVRDRETPAPRQILVAVDTGDLWYEKFGWAKYFVDRFDARLTIFHAMTLSPFSQVKRMPGGEFVSATSVWMKDDVEASVLPAMREWLWERVHLAGLPEDRVEVVLGLQEPSVALPQAIERYKADLAIVAAHRSETPERTPLSRIARAVIDGGTYPVLVVVDRARGVAARRADAAFDSETPTDAPDVSLPLSHPST